MSDIPDDYYDRAVLAIAATAVKLSFNKRAPAVLLLAEAIGKIGDLGLDEIDGCISRRIVDALKTLTAN